MNQSEKPSNKKKSNLWVTFDVVNILYGLIIIILSISFLIYFIIGVKEYELEIFNGGDEYLRLFGISILFIFGVRILSMGLKILKERYIIRSIFSIIIVLLFSLFLYEILHNSLDLLETVLFWLVFIPPFLIFCECLLLVFNTYLKKEKIKLFTYYYQFVLTILFTIPFILFAYYSARIYIID